MSGTLDSKALRLNVEEVEGRWVAHVLPLWGCFASAETRELAIDAAPQAIREYARWQRSHGVDWPEPNTAAEVDEIHRAWDMPSDYEVNAFFATDRILLTEAEITEALVLLTWTREDLRDAMKGLSPQVLETEADGGWPISRILNHIALAENWYLRRFEMAAAGAMDHPDVWERLTRVRARLVQVLPGLAGDGRVVVLEGEHWSPRKMLRRAIWHERDHTDHIRQVRQRLIETA